MKRHRQKYALLKKLLASFVIIWLSAVSPSLALAEEEATDATGEPTGAPSDTGAPACTGAGCTQGEDQGTNQGEDQGTDQGEDLGGPSAEDLGADEDGNLPEGVEDTRQGASQGTDQGDNTTTATNTNTGSDSENTNEIDSDSQTDTSVNNKVKDNSDVDAVANTGKNNQNENTLTEGVKTGNANIGVTQVKNDNTAVVGGTSGLNTKGHNGDMNEDLTLDFNDSKGKLTGDENDKNGSNGSVRAVNSTTGSDSENTVDINSKVEKIKELQNDGKIDNKLDLKAITGLNQANKNTGDGSIVTGDANVAATLVNLLNSAVINGDLWVTVADIFGDLNGDVILPELKKLAAEKGIENIEEKLDIEASNEKTGSDSDNKIDVEVKEEEKTKVANEAEIKTEVNADAVTGENETMANTGGGEIETGEGSVSASNISLANTTVENGNWGLVVVNSLNKWLGFMINDRGDSRQLSQEETIREIEARNQTTGSDSDNEITIKEEKSEQTEVANKAQINNEINAAAITGQNEANKNTGQGKIKTGNANIKASAVNIANTTVKDGSLFVAVVNVFGDWFGDLLYDDTSLLAKSNSAKPSVNVNASNRETGSNSENEIEVSVERSEETKVDNEAELETVLNSNIETGGNKSSRNTLGGKVKTGNGQLALHSRAIANTTGINVSSVADLNVQSLNDKTGFESKNKIKARLNENRLIEINNSANVSTIIGAAANTGNNQANKNTTGGRVDTGQIDALVGVENLINRVMLAMAKTNGDDINLSQNLANTRTGASSENNNRTEAIYNLLAKLDNEGVVNNLIDLLLNTGHNEANENTGGGLVSSGSANVKGSIDNDVNRNKLAGLGGNWSLDLNNQADIYNEFNVTATTGHNETDKNTGSLVEEDEEETPEPTPTPEPSQDPQEDMDGAGGGLTDEDEGEPEEDEKTPKVAALIDFNPPRKKPRTAGGQLKRFPVAGELNRSSLFQGKDNIDPWSVFAISGALLLAAGWHLDKNAKDKQWQSSLLANV